MLKNLAEGQKKVPRRKCLKSKTVKSVSFKTVYFSLFPVQANKQSILLTTGQKVCMQIPVVIL